VTQVLDACNLHVGTNSQCHWHSVLLKPNYFYFKCGRERNRGNIFSLHRRRGGGLCGSCIAFAIFSYDEGKSKRLALEGSGQTSEVLYLRGKRSLLPFLLFLFSQGHGLDFCDRSDPIIPLSTSTSRLALVSGSIAPRKKLDDVSVRWKRILVTFFTLSTRRGRLACSGIMS
ncbi:unnamed protein product, partial [Amoebophrya sp. A25]